MAKWFSEGIRFSCLGCGECCVDRGDYAWVFLNKGEEKTLARSLCLAVPDFLKEFTVDVEGFTALANRGDICVFLTDENKCKVYEARPLQCRTWPFWPETLGKTLWKKEVAPNCRGIGKGRLHDAKEIEKIADRSRRASALHSPQSDHE